MLFLAMDQCYYLLLFFFQKMSAVFDLPMMSDFHELYFLFHFLIGAGWKEKCQYIHNLLTNLTSQSF